MRCVVTGVAGFIGSTLADVLLAQGHEVVGIDCFHDYYAREIKEANLVQARDSTRFQFIETNLLADDLIAHVEGADYIFHQAAQAGVRKSWGSYFATYTENNIMASQRLLELARQSPLKDTLKKIVYASSSSIYGSSETLPTTENIVPHPLSPYGVTKLAAEHLMTLYCEEFFVPTISLRYFTVYGPRQRPDMAFNIFLKAALKGDEIVVYGDGEQSRDFTFVKDIVAANIAAATGSAKGEAFNIGGGSRVTVNEVLSVIGDLVGHPLRVRYADRQKGDARHTSAETSKANRILAYQPSVSLRDGLAEELRWMAGVLG